MFLELILTQIEKKSDPFVNRQMDMAKAFTISFELGSIWLMSQL